MGMDKPFRSRETFMVDRLNQYIYNQDLDGKKKPEENKDDDQIDPIDDEFNFQSRYFLKNPTEICRRCGKSGHFEKWCTEEPQTHHIRCKFCLGPHEADQCE
mmetsp:Transcript_27590/g.24263  ORF Transcript_27590/g.24263 Transcript_27590/m.24263 type:complete len:102 (+) Transcript_27590:990-1295(+)